MIVRVFCPTTLTSGLSQYLHVDETTSYPDHSDCVTKTDGVFAMEEVRMAYENIKVIDCLDLSPEGDASLEAALKRYVL